MASLKNFRKPQERKQGLKILIYGTDGVGKSLLALTFPKIAYIDAESKIGTYENNPRYNKNLLYIMDTNNYSKLTEAFKEILYDKNNCGIETVVLDSETNIYETMQVSMMKVEEERAKIKAVKGNKNVENAIDDAVISQRGHGKIKHRHNELKSLKLNLSSVGVTIITIAHQKDQFENNIKIGEIPDLRSGARHDYDIVIKAMIQKNLMNGKDEYIIKVEKDTTEIFDKEEIINLTWENGEVNTIFYDRLKDNINKSDVRINNYESIESLVKESLGNDNEIRDITFNEMVGDFQQLFIGLNQEKKEEIKKMLKEKNVTNLKDIKYFNEIQEIMEYLKSL